MEQLVNEGVPVADIMAAIALGLAVMVGLGIAAVAALARWARDRGRAER